MKTKCSTPVWLARATVGFVFMLNVMCAIQFVAWPDRYAPSFGLSGVPGATMVRGLGLLFLMWNATYPPVIWAPHRHRTLFAIVLVQQAIGLAGETWMWAQLPSGHPQLSSTGLRFVLFDGVGLVLMCAAYVVLAQCLGRHRD